MEWIYRVSWLGRMAVDAIADDMTREGIELNAVTPPEDIERIEAAFDTLQLWEGANATTKWGRLYGGAIGVYLIDGQPLHTPLRLETVAPGRFKGILALNRWQVEPSLEDLVTDLGPNLGLPKYYRVLSNAPALRGKTIHHSRVFRIIGAELPYQQAVNENLWGCSVYEQVYDRMIAFDSGTMGAAQLLHKAHLRTVKIDGYRDLLASGGQFLSAFNMMMAQLRAGQTSEGLTILDSKDEFVPHNISISSGIPETLLQLIQQVSGAIETPLVRLLGQSPAGLNATGDSDWRNYYDGIKKRQKRVLNAPVKTIVQLVAQNEKIKLPKNWGFTFRSLWQMTDKEKGEINERDTLTVLEAMDRGLIGKATALREVKENGRAVGRWTNITDEMITEAENEPPPIPELGAPGQPGGPSDEPLPLASFAKKALPSLEKSA
jgi:phage-related protein (TIGR01555 family)